MGAFAYRHQLENVLGLLRRLFVILVRHYNTYDHRLPCPHNIVAIGPEV